MTKIHNSLYLVNLFLVSQTLTSPSFKGNREGHALKVTLSSKPFMKNNSCQHHEFDFHHFLFFPSFSCSYRMCSILFFITGQSGIFSRRREWIVAEDPML